MFKILLLKFIQRFLIFIRNFDGFFTTWSEKIFPKKYKIKGICKQCGLCCTQIAIYLSTTFWTSTWLFNLVIDYYAFVYNFKFIRREEDYKVVIFSCNFLKNNHCSIYKKRPYICKNYPNPRYFEKPAFLPNCGFKEG